MVGWFDVSAARLPARQPVCLSVCLLACLPASLSVCLPACLPAPPAAFFACFFSWKKRRKNKRTRTKTRTRTRTGITRTRNKKQREQDICVCKPCLLAQWLVHHLPSWMEVPTSTVCVAAFPFLTASPLSSCRYGVNASNCEHHLLEDFHATMVRRACVLRQIAS